MSTPKEIVSALLEWTNDGYEYLYDENPELMKKVEDFLIKKRTKISTIYRRSDWIPILNANQGDLLELNRISSWSYDYDMPNQKYEGIDSRMLILNNSIVKGMDIDDISPYKDEQEIILAPCLLFVEKKEGDILYVKTINKIIEDYSE